VINTDIVIIGGGLSGLHTAYELNKQGRDFQLFEAGDRLGGRVHTLDYRSCLFDMGPSWFWPGQQQMLSLVAELGLTESVFEQYSRGDALYESLQSPIQRGVSGISMSGSYRIDGGISKIINGLSVGVEECIHKSTPITKMLRSSKGIELTSSAGKVQAKKVVIAAPPRVALKHIRFSPAITESRLGELKSIETWMAGHAKAVVIYEKPFWRNAGFSGDVISQLGPLSEIHDASPSSEEVFALFGFLATPAKDRVDSHAELTSQILDQLVRLFGSAAANALYVHIKDWARDPWVATAQCQSMPSRHPMNHWSSYHEPGWRKRLIWSGSETAPGHFNGYLEGALLASRQCLQHLTSTRPA